LQKNFFQNNAVMLLLTFLATITTIFFINSYCITFDFFGLLAKIRLLDHPVSIFFVTPALFWASAYICRRFALNASGNSMGHVKKALEIVKSETPDLKNLSSFLSIRVVVVKTISSLLCVLGGGALGREGPAVHMSSAIFAVIGNKFKTVLPKITLETWIFAGSAAGLAIAFHAPIAGFVFVSEKLLKTKSQHFRNNITWSLVVILIFAFLSGADPIFMVSDFSFESSLLFFLTAIFIAIFCGLLAFIFKKTNDHFYQKLSAIKSNFWHLVPITAGLAVACISSYSGVHSFSGGIYTVEDALSSSDILLSYKEVIGRIFNTIISFIAGCAGGLVAPSITIGAGIGSIASLLLADIDTNIFILIGMVGFLAAVLGEPATAAIVVFEITGQSVDRIPLLLSMAVLALFALKVVEKVSGKMKKA